MNVNERLKLIKQVGMDIITEDQLVELLKKKKRGDLCVSGRFLSFL